MYKCNKLAIYKTHLLDLPFTRAMPFFKVTNESLFNYTKI